MRPSRAPRAARRSITSTRRVRRDVPLRRGATLIALVAVLAIGSLPSPITEDASGQPVSLQCRPPDDRDNQQGTDRKFHDYVVNATTITMKTASGNDAGSTFGAYLVFEELGSLEVDFVIENIGTDADAPVDAQLQPANMPIRVDLRLPDGSITMQTTTVVAAAAGGIMEGSVTFADLTDEGPHVVTVRVNHDQSIEEDCEDSGASARNPNCTDENGAPTACHFTYYFNNNETFDLLVGSFPDLRVKSVDTTGPLRASRTASGDTRVTVEAVIENVGTADAVAHTGAADPFKVAFEIVGGRCGGATVHTVNVSRIAPDQTETVRATCDVAGLAGKAEAKVTADNQDVVFETRETNNERRASIVIPAPDIVTDVETGLTFEGGAFLLPEGSGLELNITIENRGDAAAVKADGTGFTTLLECTCATTNREFTTVLDPFSSIVEPAFFSAAQLPAPTDGEPYTVRILPDMKNTQDTQGDVLESDEKNLLEFDVLVASFEVNLTGSETFTKVAPGVPGKIPLTVKNAGTVRDSIRLTTSSEHASAVRFIDDSDATISEVALDPGASLDAFIEFTMPHDARKGRNFTIEAIAASQTLGSGATDSHNVTFQTGPDDFPPTIELHDPETGFLRGDTVKLRVTDNVRVEQVEIDLSGTFEEIFAEDGTSIYPIDVSGRPGRFSFAVRATDNSSNEITRTVTLVRDTTDPRILSYEFSPASGNAVPGSTVRITVDARDDNMEKVFVEIFQANEYRTTVDAARRGNEWIAEWTTPAKAGRFFMKIFAEDAAGNLVEARDNDDENLFRPNVAYFVEGRDLEVVGLPQVAPRAPGEGDTIRFTYLIRNTDTRFESGQFELRFALDLQTYLDRRFMELGPGETKPVTFTWDATPGPHTFTLVVDQSDQVWESNELNNLEQTTTTSLFRGQALFEAEEIRPAGFLTFNERVERFWFVPVLVATNVVLFVVALVLGRRPGA